MGGSVLGMLCLCTGLLEGLGIAVLNMARAVGARVIGTCSEGKREFVKGTLGVADVFDSRSLSFVSGVRGIVGDKGVDVVVNSLAGEAMQASVRLVGRGGRFVEVGKADIHGGSKLSLEVFAAGVTYASVMLDEMIMSGEDDGAVGEYLQEWACGTDAGGGCRASSERV